ncbi:App1 family protein [Spirosoma daeguense]
MGTSESPSVDKLKKSVKDRLRHNFLTWLRLTDRPVVKLYRGFGNNNSLTVHGSVLRRSALPRKTYRNNFFLNLFGLLRLFLVRPYPHATIRVLANGKMAETQSDTDGYFRVDVPLSQPLDCGWHDVRAQLLAESSDSIRDEAEGQVLVPQQTEFGCISDIDDTFLVSHSATILKRLKVLLTRNAYSRQPFEGVVAHYQLLAEANSGTATNPFFYVSSSEWNLYDYILAFSKKNGLPKGVYLLSPLKQLSEVLKTGQGKHMTKFARIVRILEAYPNQRFILLGDDTQEDPTIYASLVKHFSQRIVCVYIRQVHGKNEPKTRDILREIELKGIPCCYFAHSADARQHSLQLGLVAT